MKNYVQPGEVLEVTAPTDGVVSGSCYKIGDLVVCATVDALETEKFNALLVGVIEHSKVSAQAWTEGAKIYFDNGTGLFTTTSGGNTLVGVSAEAADNPSATGLIRLDGVVR
jgi:predicted RecA/RadA family phage recombinase